MSETALPINPLDLYYDLVGDPEKAQFMYDLLTGQQPRMPKDEALRSLYKGAAITAFRAPKAERPLVRYIITKAREAVYTDDDYAAADFVS